MSLIIRSVENFYDFVFAVAVGLDNLGGAGWMGFKPSVRGAGRCALGNLGLAIHRILGVARDEIKFCFGHRSPPFGSPFTSKLYQVLFARSSGIIEKSTGALNNGKKSSRRV